MDQQDAQRVAARVWSHRGYHYTPRQLHAERFAMGWSVRMPAAPGMEGLALGQPLMLVGDDGSIEESRTSLFAGVAEARFVQRRGG